MLQCILSTTFLPFIFLVSIFSPFIIAMISKMPSNKSSLLFKIVLAAMCFYSHLIVSLIFLGNMSKTKEIANYLIQLLFIDISRSCY